MVISAPISRPPSAIYYLPLLQATTTSSVGRLFLADAIDGCTSCMLPVCQAYVTDVSPPEQRAINLGVFQGLAIGGAFIVGGPLGGVLGKKIGARAVMKGAAGLQLLSFAILMLFTPESLADETREEATLDLKEANPFGALKLLFGGAPLLRGVATGRTVCTPTPCTSH